MCRDDRMLADQYDLIEVIYTLMDKYEQPGIQPEQLNGTDSTGLD